NTQHLYDPGAKATSGQARWMVMGGAGLMVAALGLFLHTVWDVARESDAREEAEKAAAKSGTTIKFELKPRSGAADVGAFGLLGVGIALVYMGLKRWEKSNPDYIIGPVPEADAPVAPEFTGGGAHVLVGASGSDYLVNVTPQMTGEVFVDNQTMPLSHWVQQR